MAGFPMKQEFHLYFYALIPPEDIQSYVSGVKMDFKERFESVHALKSPPHITLIPPFRYKSVSEDQLIKTLDNFTFQESKLNLSLKDFGFFPPRVVFIKVDKSEILKSMFYRFKKHMDRKLDLSSFTRGSIKFSPHMTVAHRDLTRENFNKAKPIYEEKQILFEFEVNGISLLKHDGKKWQVIHSGDFKR
jgi:2'-5' RNA ligase